MSSFCNDMIYMFFKGYIFQICIYNSFLFIFIISLRGGFYLVNLNSKIERAEENYKIFHNDCKDIFLELDDLQEKCFEDGNFEAYRDLAESLFKPFESCGEAFMFSNKVKVKSYIQSLSNVVGRDFKSGSSKPLVDFLEDKSNIPNAFNNCLAIIINDLYDDNGSSALRLARHTFSKEDFEISFPQRRY